MRELDIPRVGTAPRSTLADTLSAIRELVPGAWVDGELDFDALKEALGNPVAAPDRFLFTWSGKRDAIRASQEPSWRTLRPDRERSIAFDETSNVIISGDNLEALKILYQSYFDRVKFVYIDPPYNTGNDLIYQDDFSKSRDRYLAETGQLNLEGMLTTSKAETAGRLHSAWLSMMYARLTLAKALMRRDGVIAISIGERELGNLLLLMNEIFGEENRESIIAWRRRHNQPNDPTKMIATVAEFIVVYAKNSDTLKARHTFFGLPLSGERRAGYRNPDGDPRGPWDSKPWKAAVGQGGSRYEITTPSGKVLTEMWLGSRETFAALEADARIYWPREGDGLPRKKFFLSERDETGQAAHNFWGHGEFGSNQEGSAELAEVMGEKNVFDNPKPIKLVKSLISIACGKDDIVMDFFAGTGTTALATLQLNAEDNGARRFVLVQLPEPIDHPQYKTLFDVCVARVTRFVSGTQTGFRVLNVAESNIARWDPPASGVSAEEYDLRLSLTMDGLRKGWTAEGVLTEIALNEGYGAAPRIEVLTQSGNLLYKCTSAETSRAFYACLDEAITQQFAEDIGGILDKNSLLVCRDTALDDTTATNLAYACRLKVI